MDANLGATSANTPAVLKKNYSPATRPQPKPATPASVPKMNPKPARGKA